MKGTSTAISLFLAFIPCRSAFAQSAEAIQNESSYDAYHNRGPGSHVISSISHYHHVQSPAIAQWVQSQLLLFILSCMMCVVLYYIAPQLISNSTSTLSLKPLKSLGMGAAFSTILALIVLSTFLLNPIRTLEPLAAAVNLCVCTLLFAGFVTFSASLSKIFPARFTQKSNHWVKSTFSGLVVLFGINIVIGLVGAGGVGIVLDLLFSMAGLGALSITLLNTTHTR